MKTKLTLMADYYADPLWDEEGVNLDLKDFPISAELRNDLENWVDSYTGLLRQGHHEPTQIFIDKLNSEGEELLKRLQVELPEYEITHRKEKGRY